MIGENTKWDIAIDIFIYIVLGIIAISSVAPFMHVVSVSFSSSAAVASDSVGLLPVGFNLDNYAFVMESKDFFNSLWISVARVFVGVITTLIVVLVTAYPLSLDHLRVPGRLYYKGFLLIGLLFTGGLIPTFISYSEIGLINNFLVLILPLAINVFFIIIMINFMRGIPRELSEAAWLDGASHFDVLIRIYIPISKPAIATITLFSAVVHWNQWFDGLVFMQRVEDWPLQTWLYSLVTTRQIQWASSGSDSASFLLENATPDGLAAALIVLAALPIILVYPFLQRFFVTGLTLGSVKS